SKLFIEHQINLGQFVASEIIIITILNSIEKMILSLEVIYDVLTSLEKINKVLDKPVDEDIKSSIKQEWLTTPALDLKINDLSFVYPNQKKVINQLSLHLKPSEKVCLVGTEGSGKSTLVKLICGFYKNFEGNILLNDVPIKMIPKTVIHQNLSVLFADDDLFTGTVLENITLGNMDFDKQHLDHVCKIVGLTEFIKNEQKGLETSLDPQGKKLSYNTIQKILLARCLLKKPSLLLIEDNWVGIESKIREQVINYLTDKNSAFTMVAVTNDEAFINKCNVRYEVKNGSINPTNQ
ncbi:ABC transporter ATP-binding protein/permease, partial [Pelobium sp.]